MAGVELSGPFFQCPWRTFTICCQQKRQRFLHWPPPVLCVWFLFSIRCQQKRQMFHGSQICSSPPSCLLSHVWLRYIYSTTLITVDVMLGVSTSDPQPPTSFHPSQLMEVMIFCRRPLRQQDLGNVERPSPCKGTNKVGIQ